LHNEWGDAWQRYPNWEGPVRAWAEANGMLLPPNEKDDSYSTRPSISITHPANNSTISGQTTITVSINSEHGVSDVTYYLNDAQIGSSSNSPYSSTFDTTKYANGTYKLTAKLSDSNGVTSETSIQINIQNGPAAKITNITVSSITANSAVVQFQTDIACNSTVYFGTNAGTLSSSVTSGLQTTNHSATLTGLASGTKYYFKIVATNSAGGQSSFEGNFNTS
jgi:hypothetical protein